MALSGSRSAAVRKAWLSRKRGGGALGISGRVRGAAARKQLAGAIRNERATDFRYGSGLRGGKARGLSEAAAFLKGTQRGSIKGTVKRNQLAAAIKGERASNQRYGGSTGGKRAGLAERRLFTAGRNQLAASLRTQRATLRASGKLAAARTAYLKVKVGR